MSRGKLVVHVVRLSESYLVPQFVAILTMDAFHTAETEHKQISACFLVEVAGGSRGSVRCMYRRKDRLVRQIEAIFAWKIRMWKCSAYKDEIHDVW